MQDSEELPEGHLPLGSIDAYDQAYNSKTKPGTQIDKHIAGLRAVIMNDRQTRAQVTRKSEAERRRVQARLQQEQG